jgi:Tol biopolymer transport system component
MPTVGDVRSSISTDGTSLYFTSKGSGANGYLWMATKASSTSPPTVSSVQLLGTSTSTPTISANNRIYVGYYIGSDDGGVQVFNKSLSPMGTFAPGAPVQCSPIVYSISTGSILNQRDYIYFTTNTENGAGFGYIYAMSTGATAMLWNAAGTSSNPYALQGFSAENGYLAYGDDGDYLYIVKP